MPEYAVGIQKEKDLRDRMIRLGVREEDIVERFIRSAGPGGQNVNKTSTCVYLKHLPTGIEVKCREERSQGLNRYRARVILLSKIEQSLLGALSQERQRIEKIRRQKRRRSRKTRLKLLELKKRRAEKKGLRSAVRRIDLLI